MTQKVAFYAHSGGVTAVLNTTAAGLIETARENNITVLAGHNGLLGALNEELIDTTKESSAAIAALRHTPGSAFGSCRYKLKSIEEDHPQYERLLNVFSAHNIGYFFYNGGGDSQDTAYKISQVSEKMGYPLTCIGIPKTVDNDLAFTDNCPGFGSAAKYVATSIREAGLDVVSMAATSTKVFILEVMGRHAGWLAAASGLATQEYNDPPHIILFPEIPFNSDKFLGHVEKCEKAYGYCVIVVSEGIRNEEGRFLTDAGLKDAFGHTQLGGVAPIIANLIKSHLGLKYHWALADYLQRSARHLASRIDAEQAYTLGKAAIEYAVAGKNNIMLTIVRKSDEPYQWSIGQAPLEKVANVERKMPMEFISKDGFHITDECRCYLKPLIQGEDYPPYVDGLPNYVKLKNNFVAKKLNAIVQD